MSEQITSYRNRQEWVAYTQDFVVLWEYTFDGHNLIDREMHGFYIYGATTSINVRKLPWKLVETADPENYPRWDLGEMGVEDYDIGGFRPNPPTMDEVTEAWKAQGAAVVGTTPPKLTPRQPGETVTDFYQRIADGYRAVAFTGKPTTAIAEIAGVPKSTAARWVRESRKRGFLATTTQGKVNR